MRNLHRNVLDLGACRPGEELRIAVVDQRI
jgi:hypothetical protein